MKPNKRTVRVVYMKTIQVCNRRVTPTSNPGTKSFNYVMKIPSRIEGPWADNDP
eukprot:COSAG02_NODE_72712_length_182_cov_17.855422_1_plen_53_part_10